MIAWVENLTILSFSVAIMVGGGVFNSQAADFGGCFGHKPSADLKFISSVDLTVDEQAALKSVMASYAPALMEALHQVRAAKKKLRDDLHATSPDGTTLAADATAVATAKVQLKGMCTQLDTAPTAALSPEHLLQLQSGLTALFQNRLNAKTGHLLTSYTRIIEKQ